MKRRFALTSLLNIISVGLGFIIGLFITPFMLRTLGIEAYGVWILVTTFSVTSGYLSLLDLGLQSAVVKFVAEHYARMEVAAINQVFSVGLYLFGGLGLLGACVLILFAHFYLTLVFKIPPNLIEMAQILLYLLSIQILVEFPGLIISAVVDGLQRYDIQRVIQIGYVIFNSLLVIVLLGRGYGLVVLSITMLVLTIIKVLVLVTIVRRLLPTLRLVRNFDRKLIRRVVEFSGQIFLLRINAVIYNTMDKTIIGSLLTTTQLTGYDIANKLRTISYVPLSFITPQVVPAAATLHGADDQVGLRELFLKGTKYQMAISVPVIVTVLILTERFIRVWIGPDYTYLANLARLFVVSVFFDAMIAVGQNMMIGIGRVKPLLWIAIVSTIINLGVSVFLTIKIGIAGVMWGTFIGLAVSLVPYYWLYSDILKISGALLWREIFWPIYSVAVVMAVLLFFAERKILLPDNFLTLGILGMFGVGVFFVLFWIFGLGVKERKMLVHTVVQVFNLR